MKKLFIVTFAVGTVLLLSGCMEQILAVPKAGVNAVTGITPHEHKGRGTPSIDAIKTEEYDLPPKYLDINSTVRTTERTPDIKNPRIKNGAISLNNANNCVK